MTLTVFLACVFVLYVVAALAIAYGLVATSPHGQSRLGFAALPVGNGQYMAVSATVLLFRLDGPAFAFPLLASLGAFFVALAVAVVCE